MTAATLSMTPRDAIVTLYGGYLRDLGNWIAIADMVVLLGELGIDEQSARSAIARLKRTRLLESARHHGSAGYSAGSDLLDILADGDVRIFQSQLAADLHDGWVLVVFSVPETQRDRRHQLRARLSALGCAPLAAGVWMAPRRVSPDVRRVLRRLDLAKYSSLFEGSYEGFTDLHQLVGTTWNVGTLTRHYTSFTSRNERRMARWRRAVPAGSDAFVEYTMVLEQWRKLAYEDPGLPDEVSPCATQRGHARELFTAAMELLAGPAKDHVGEVIGERRLASIPAAVSGTGRGR